MSNPPRITQPAACPQAGWQGLGWVGFDLVGEVGRRVKGPVAGGRGETRLGRRLRWGEQERSLKRPGTRALENSVRQGRASGATEPLGSGGGTTWPGEEVKGPGA